MAKDEEQDDELEEQEAGLEEDTGLDEEFDSEELSGSRPSTEANVVIELLAGALGTIAISLAVLPLRGMAPGLRYIYEIINERGPVQYFELFMAFMVMAMVIMKSRIVRDQLSVVSEGPIEPDLDLSDDNAIMEAREKVRASDEYQWSILANRVDRMLGLWLSTKDVSRIATWAGAESERDANASDSTYAMARVLIWAIPILGFIGTVLGLGTAVAGFSDFLSGAAGLEEIQGAIGDVTSGLGTAFDTTLLALILSVILMFPMSVVLRREENLFVEIDNYLDDMLMSRFPVQEQQSIVIDNLEDSIEAAFRRYIPDPDRYETVFTQAIERASTTVEERFGLLAKGYESALNGLTARLASSVTGAGNALEESMQRIVTDIQTQEDTLLERRQQVMAGELEQIKAVAQELQQVSAETIERYKQEAAALQDAHTQSAAEARQAAEAMADRMKEVVALAAGIQDLLKVEQAVEQGLQGIATSQDFQETLSTLRDHLRSTDDFCKRLNKPRVITLREETI